jgi:short-subunit dehydrogenase
MPKTSEHPTTTRPTALVTGASSGIGVELARQLARRGHDLVLTARRADRLESLAEELTQRHGARARVLVEDLADPAAPTRIRDFLAAEAIAIDVLVNNAGFGAHGQFARLALPRQMGILQVNVMALTNLTGLLLPGLLARPRGRILNVASIAGFMPLPRLAVYAASKAYVVSFSAALQAELSNTKVSVTCLCPGATATGFAEAAGMGRKRMFRGAASAESVARLGLEGMFAGRPVVVTGTLNRLLAGVVGLVPKGLVLYVAKKALR